MRTLADVVSTYGADAKKRLSNPAVVGAPEDQLRGPIQGLLSGLADLLGLPSSELVAVGEASLSDLKVRPDFSITLKGVLVGFIELKAPGKGADPRQFRDKHDKQQWEKLQSLPNLIYSDGNAFSLWQDGELACPVVHLEGDVASSGALLTTPPSLHDLFERFLLWSPISPRNAKDLARITARLCRLLRDEVTEQLEHSSPALTELSKGWRKLLFPDASDERFADGYAQAVTFGLLVARARGIELATSFHLVSEGLAKGNSLIGAALDLLTQGAEKEQALKTSLGALIRVLDVVDWQKVSKGKPEAWLYFYEDFLATYDNDLRKQTGSYYTPPEVVGSMIRLVDDVLRSPRFGLPHGLAADEVTIADPAAGTGTFLLGLLQAIHACISEDQGAGTANKALEAVLKRLVAFEMQLGPFAVAQLRVLAEVLELTGSPPAGSLRMYVTDTLGNPKDDDSWIPTFAAPIAESRKEANQIKRDEAITVVIGNPPYKEKAKGLGGWVENGGQGQPAPLLDWKPPTEWGVGAHAKHLRNLYVYFWRWATWKVFDQQPQSSTGVVCFITVAGFLAGPGFQRMRDDLRRTCDDIWVIDCSPEGHQPGVSTRVFQGVQQPVCIVLASRSAPSGASVPARVRFRALPAGHRLEKFDALQAVALDDEGWKDCSEDWRAPFLPEAKGAWASFPALDDLFSYNGSGVMPGRVWVIAPDSESLERRWARLVEASASEKEDLFHPHLKDGLPGDRHVHHVSRKGLAGFELPHLSVSEEVGSCLTPIRYGFRSLDRQWIIPDKRLINRPNPKLWELRSNDQIYLCALSRTAPTSGPALMVSGLVPDHDFYKGSFAGRAFPLWAGADTSVPNLSAHVTARLQQDLGTAVGPSDVFAYIVAVAAHPKYTERFQDDLTTPGLRIPVTADATLFTEAAAVGRQVVWLQTFGERMADADAGRPPAPPRLPAERRPTVPAEGAIPSDPEQMPDSLEYDPVALRLHVGGGYIDQVSPEMWAYEISGKQVLAQWFGSRRRVRTKPIIGTRRPPSPLGAIQPEHWVPEYTSDLLDLLNVIGGLIDLEPLQADLLERIVAGPLISADQLQAASADDEPGLFD